MICCHAAPKKKLTIVVISYLHMVHSIAAPPLGNVHSAHFQVSASSMLAAAMLFSAAAGGAGGSLT